MAPLLTYASLDGHRAAYETVKGGKPPLGHLPSHEQLSALKYLIFSLGKAPFVCFAIWSIDRTVAPPKSDAAVWEDGAFVTRRIPGPSSFSSWKICWHTFAAAMISLGAASPGALDLYLAGLEELLRLFPNHEDTLLAADLVVRSSRWSALREDCERYRPAGYDPARPWDFIIGASAFGDENTKMSSWWNTRVVIPCTKGSATTSAQDLSSPAAAPPAPRSEHQRKKGDKERRRSRSKKRGARKPLCSNFNLKLGRCSGDGPCSADREHRCFVCGDGHRAVDKHSKEMVEKAKKQLGLNYKDTDRQW